MDLEQLREIQDTLFAQSLNIRETEEVAPIAFLIAEEGVAMIELYKQENSLWKTMIVESIRQIPIHIHAVVINGEAWSVPEKDTINAVAAKLASGMSLKNWPGSFAIVHSIMEVRNNREGGRMLSAKICEDGTVEDPKSIDHRNEGEFSGFFDEA